MTRAPVRQPWQAPSVARARVWAPLGLLLVLAGGAWCWRDAAWPGATGASGTASPGAGVIQPWPESTQALPVAVERANPGAQASAPAAAQVLDEVAQRGRQARAATLATQSAESLQARLRQDPAAVHRQTAGQRLRLQGALASVEAGEPGVVVLHLALADEPGTVRVVASPALAQVASTWAPPKALSLDCLSQGVMMGEWLLVDCRE